MVRSKRLSKHIFVFFLGASVLMHGSVGAGAVVGRFADADVETMVDNLYYLLSFNSYTRQRENRCDREFADAELLHRILDYGVFGRILAAEGLETEELFLVLSEGINDVGPTALTYEKEALVKAWKGISKHLPSSPSGLKTLSSDAIQSSLDQYNEIAQTWFSEGTGSLLAGIAKTMIDVNTPLVSSPFNQSNMQNKIRAAAANLANKVPPTLLGRRGLLFMVRQFIESQIAKETLECLDINSLEQIKSEIVEHISMVEAACCVCSLFGSVVTKLKDTEPKYCELPGAITAISAIKSASAGALAGAACGGPVGAIFGGAGALIYGATRSSTELEQLTAARTQVKAESSCLHAMASALRVGVESLESLSVALSNYASKLDTACHAAKKLREDRRKAARLAKEQAAKLDREQEKARQEAQRIAKEHAEKLKREQKKARQKAEKLQEEQAAKLAREKKEREKAQNDLEERLRNEHQAAEKKMESQFTSDFEKLKSEAEQERERLRRGLQADLQVEQSNRKVTEKKLEDLRDTFEKTKKVKDAEWLEQHEELEKTRRNVVNLEARMCEQRHLVRELSGTNRNLAGQLKQLNARCDQQENVIEGTSLIPLFLDARRDEPELTFEQFYQRVQNNPRFISDVLGLASTQIKRLIQGKSTAEQNADDGGATCTRVYSCFDDEVAGESGAAHSVDADSQGDTHESSDDEGYVHVDGGDIEDDLDLGCNKDEQAQ